MNARTNVTIVSAGLLLAIVLCIPSNAAANILVDPEFDGIPPLNTLPVVFGPPFILGQWGAENGAIVGTTGGVTPLTATTMLAEYYDGSGYTQTMQATDVSSYPAGTTFTLSAYFNVDQNLSAAQPFVNLSFYDAAYTNLGGSLSSAPTVLDSNPATWELISVTTVAPPSTNYVVSQVMYLDSSLLLSTGALGTGFVDSASLRAVPEPTTVVLLGMGVVGLAGIAWRRKRAHGSRDA